ncbi:PREDICTED: coiled-coil domain-containing protein 115-like [Polistes dominula]|uniref:Vacuolar ATPase assembly protein VMA22 n=1 Tax=Polistes dominula TaxID=743375 RepID=A0ABM1HXT0_POLDO|nr:PREDICTED: coiled-coil domain-containing protein 115-like [Polistes dominula]
MEKNIDDICNAIDKLVLRNLELIEEKVSTNVQMELLLRSGHIELAKARYISGKENVSILQIPVNMENISSLFELESKFTEESDGKTSSFDISLRKENEFNEDIQNPIKWFGVLVPRNLRTAQKYFQESVYLAAKVANIHCELDSIANKLKALYLLKNAFSKQTE